MMIISIILSYAVLALANQLDVKFEFKYIDFDWETSQQKQYAVDRKDYIPSAVFPIDVDKIEGKVFVTTPRTVAGVPASLSIVTKLEGPGGPLLHPFPDWSWHNRTDCSGITSVWRVYVDDCDRFWVLDTGKVDSVQLCSAQLLAFSTKTYKLLERRIIPDSLLFGSYTNGTGLLVTPVVETEDRCHKTWIYIADVDGRGLIIVDEGRAWRLNNDVFKPSPDADVFTIAGESFQLADGVLGLAITPREKHSGHRWLIFRALSSYGLVRASTDQLHNSWHGRVTYAQSEYKLPSQVAAIAISRDGTLFFGLTTQIALGCWNTRKTFNQTNVVVVAENTETLQFVSGMKVKSSWGEHIWLLSNRFQKIMTGTLDLNEINFRILSGSVGALTDSTNC